MKDIKLPTLTLFVKNCTGSSHQSDETRKKNKEHQYRKTKCHRLRRTLSYNQKPWGWRDGGEGTVLPQPEDQDWTPAWLPRWKESDTESCFLTSTHVL